MKPKKVCSKCGVPKYLDEFPVNRTKKDGRGYQCRECHKGYVNNHYAENTAYYIKKARDQRKALRAFVDTLKTGPCADCGHTFPPCAMDFDHVRGHKVLAVAALVLLCSKEKILAEIAKCELVCACCHRIRTNKRR